jgi:hypothetical protein
MGPEGGCSSGKTPQGPEADSDDREADVLGDERISSTTANPMDVIFQPVTEGGNGIHSYDGQSTATSFEMVGNPGDL